MDGILNEFQHTLKGYECNIETSKHEVFGRLPMQVSIITVKEIPRKGDSKKYYGDDEHNEAEYKEKKKRKEEKEELKKKNKEEKEIQKQ